jgi:hypothetical protein
MEAPMVALLQGPYSVAMSASFPSQPEKFARDP